MQKVVQQVRQVADSPSRLSSRRDRYGKELWLGRSISSVREARSRLSPWTVVRFRNPDRVELFGYEKARLPGTQRKKGVPMAEGKLFLDEIVNLPFPRR